MSKNSKIGAALITGGAKRIGHDIALNLAKQGYDIVISYQNSQKEAENLAKKINKDFAVNCEIFCCDLRDIKQVEELAKFTKEKFSNWNLLVNNASIFNKSQFLDAENAELSNNLNIHLIAPMILAKEFANNSPENGQIINMIDKNIARFDTKYFYYLLSKKALAEFTKMLALELAPQIRVNAIAPGFIINPKNEKISILELEKSFKKIPLQHKGEIQNIIQTINFLLDNKFVTGQILFIDGGASLNHAG